MGQTILLRLGAMLFRAWALQGAQQGRREVEEDPGSQLSQSRSGAFHEQNWSHGPVLTVRGGRGVNAVMHIGERQSGHHVGRAEGHH
jgi:hypothetical protein